MLCAVISVKATGCMNNPAVLGGEPNILNPVYPVKPQIEYFREYFRENGVRNEVKQV